MAVFNEPTKWAQTLGKDADVTAIPDTAGETEPSIDKIFPSVFSIPLANGGRAIPRSVLNGLFKLVGDWIYYIQNGGVPIYNPDYDYIVGRVILYTDGNLYKCIQANSALDPKAPNDSDYWLRITTTADSPTGEIKIWPSSTIPDGFLLCNGAAVSRTTYARLFAEIGTTYGTGDGSTTFNLPDFRDRYAIGANTNVLGTQVSEQLPNIGGTMEMMNTAYGNGKGAFATSYISQTGSYQDGVGGYQYFVNFSASLSDTRYTPAGKVYPLSIAINFIIKT